MSLALSPPVRVVSEWHRGTAEYLMCQADCEVDPRSRLTRVSPAPALIRLSTRHSLNQKDN